MNTGRRAFLRRAIHTAALGGIGSIGGVGSSLLSFPASAADASGYKALVCVFLQGGIDNHDTLFPADAASYARYADIREPLLSLYQSVSGGNSNRERERLLGLNVVNAADYGSRRFALSDDMQGLRQMFNQGELAIVNNVGPLIQPVTRDLLEAPGVTLPKRLYSHNDQQSTWMSGQPEGAQFGWGGLFADPFANDGNDFIAMTGRGNEVFLTGQRARPYQFTPSGAPDIQALERLETGSAFEDALRRHLEAENSGCSNLIECDYASAMQRTLRVNALYNQALADAPNLGTPFPGTFLARQLRAVARTIAARNELGPNRQVFFVGLGGFDTHSNQVQDLPRLQRQLDESIIAFNTAMQELGVNEDVVLFTASDFGRALAVNGDGTDHGWGGHHFVVGGGVRGGRLFGEMPPPELEHDFDAGSGRLIPTTSVDQFAASLGRWFGLNDSELQSALPGLSAFGGVSPQLFA